MSAGLRDKVSRITASTHLDMRFWGLVHEGYYKPWHKDELTIYDVLDANEALAIQQEIELATEQEVERLRDAKK